MSASAPPCPNCHTRDNFVKDSRPSGKTIRRRRECPCGHRFTTYEITEAEIATMRAWRAKAIAASLTLRELSDLSDQLRRLTWESGGVTP